MIQLKTPEEIKIMIEGGRRLAEVVGKLKIRINSGVSTESIDREAEQLIRAMGGEPSFKKVKGYHWSTCTTVNEQIVHTPPSNRILKEGDLFTLDIGMYYKGFHTDFALTEIIGNGKDVQKNHFLKVGKDALQKAISQARVGNRIGDISHAIEQEVYRNNFFIIKELTGHGIGRGLHEDPFIPGFLDRPLEKTKPIRSGFVIAIEVIYSMGTERMAYEGDDSWSIVTADKSLSACFEHTVAITEAGPLILTRTEENTL